MTAKCCKCDKLRIEGAWIKQGTSTGGCFSYTYCDICLREFKREIWRERHGFRNKFVAHPQPA